MELKERLLAIVLLDLIGSTTFVERVGARRAAEWLQYHDRLTRNLIYRFNGREIDRSDGFLLSFDRCIDAVNFALHYQAQVPLKTRLNTRIGVHWGKVVEVQQDEIYTAVGAKGVELEGLSKNIAARTMSLCGSGQVLLTEEAFQAVRNRTNYWTPKNTRYVCVGLYKFKGVSEPQTLYAVGQSIESLQPPKGSHKVKRIGGPKKVRSRMRDKKFMEWLNYLIPRLYLVLFVLFIVSSWKCLTNPVMRSFFGLDMFSWVDYIDPLIDRLLLVIKEMLDGR